MAIDKLKTTSLEDNSITSDKIASGAVTISDIGDNEISMAKLSQVDLTIAPEVLEIQVDAPDMGQDTMWKWTWEQSTLPYARRTITNSNELNVPLYKEGTYVVNNFAAYDIHASMTQTHSLYLKWIDGAGTDNLISWATSAGPISDTHPDINGGNATDVQRITVNVPATITLPTLTNPSVSYTVVNNASGGYTFSGSAKGDNPNLGPFYRGGTYTVNINATGHPFYFTTDNGTNFSSGTYFGEYTSGVTGSRTDSGTITFTVPANAPDTLYYQCGNHSAMRGAITVKDLAVETNINGNYVVYFQHTQEGHRTPVELRPIPSLVNQMCLVYDNNTNKFVPQDLATYVENTPSFENKIREVAGTAELVVEDGSAVVAKVNVYDDSTYLPLTGNNPGDQAFATDTDILYIWDGSAWQQAGAANSDDLTEGSTNLFFTNARADARIALQAGSNLDLSGKSTTDLAEGTNLYYTDARVGTYLSSNDFDTATNIVASITDSAPATLDTLNELAAALGDDPNFATTTANNIAGKVAKTGDSMTGALIVAAGDNGLDVRVGTDKRILFAGNIGEIGSVAGFQAVNTAGNANTAFGIRATDIRFATGSDERVRITDTGVGIGTSSPARQLSIVDDGTNGQAIMEVIDSTNNNLAGIFLGRANNTNIGGMRYFHSTNLLALRSNDEDALIIDSSGNVGIGTANPSTALHIENLGAGSANFNKGIIIKTGDGSYTTGHGPMLEFRNEDVYMAGIRGIRENSWASGLQFFTHNSSSGNVYDTTFLERMRIDSSGNVGIGTSSPQTELHVHDSAGLAQIRLSGTASDADTFQLGQGTTGVTNGGFTIRDVEASADRLVINSSGDVGIGTNNPTEKLHVSSGSFKIDTDTNSTFKISDAGTNAIALYGGTGDELYMGANNSYSLRFKTDGNIVMDNGGNLGIGTSGPNESLHVYRSSGDASFKLQSSSQTLRIDQNSIRSTTNHAIGFFTNNNAQNGFRIENDGRMIIGNTSGQTNVKLTVAGNVKMGSAATSAWANTVNDIGGLDVIVGNGSHLLNLWDDNRQSSPRFEVERAGKIISGPAIHIDPGRHTSTYNVSGSAEAYNLMMPSFYGSGSINQTYRHAYNINTPFHTTLWQGGGGNTVFTTWSKIGAEHYKDIYIETYTLYYSDIKIKVITDGNANLSVWYAGATYNNNVYNARWRVYPLQAATVEMNPSSSQSAVYMVHQASGGRQESSNDTAPAGSGPSTW